MTRLYSFSGMPGVKRKALRAPIIKSVAEADKLLRKYRMISAANDSGCINLYRDDEGKWRCEFQRFMVTQDHKVYPTKTEALRWLKKWLPRTRVWSAPKGDSKDG